MKKDIVSYVSHYLNCQEVKYEHQKLGGLTKRLEIPEWKWEHITMDFGVGLRQTMKKYDAVWLIVAKLTKFARLIPVMTTYFSEQLARIYIRKIFHIHSVMASIISNQGTHFTLNFWRAA